ncbi:MAG TPA: FAD-dependent oxidoreductase [Syntrophorhabdaceae bacterium]|jgi:heterodisulfide reductase subunit A-like polyferredoxin
MEKVGKVLVIGGGIGGMEASLDLVEAGYKVYLADEKPNIGGKMSQLDKTFPTNDCSMCIMAPKLVEVGRNPNIDLLMNTDVVGLEGEPGNFKVTLRRRPRRVMPEKCTSCSLCAPQCPIDVSNDYNVGLSRRTGAYISFPQAIPSTYAIDREIAPCVNRCPVNLNARDYVGLIAEGRFLEALDLIRERLPFPGVIGRICAHPCEEECLRGRKVDQPVAICALKRFVADYEAGVRDIPVPATGPDKGKKVAVIGGGPAGLECALELRKAGYGVTVFEAHDKLGGMLYVGIPAYRLPKEELAREVSIVEKMGIEVKYNTRVGKDIGVNEIHDSYDAVFIGAGAHGGRSLGLDNEDARGVIGGIAFLRSVATGEPVEMGEKVFVIGGGNVAIDVALTARRLGAKEVHMACLETWDQMPAHKWEVDQAVEEGVRVHTSWGPNEIQVKDGAVKGVEFRRCTDVFDEAGRFSPRFDESVTIAYDADTVILAIGQSMDTGFLKDLPGLEVLRDGRVKADPVSLETTVAGVFAGGDVVTGPKMAIDAIAQGKEASESIIRFLEGRNLKAGRRAKEDKLVEDIPSFIEKRARVAIPSLPVPERSGFQEVFHPLTAEDARREAERCLNCRKCLGCRICEEFCKPEAINYFETPTEETIEVGSIIVSSGFEPYDATQKPELGYGIYPNVVTSVEFERILSATGPTASVIMRPSDGKIPKKIAFLQCVGSRDKVNEYCSSVCCMYATKEAVIAKEHQNDIEPTIFYMDVRAFGKGFDQYYERAKGDHGVRYVKSLVSRVLEDYETKDVEIVYVDEAGELQTESFDLVVLSVGMRPAEHLAGLASVLDLDLNEYGFIKTDRSNPLTTSRPGIYVSGACESPKDIPETVIQASGAACEAGSIISEARGKDLTIKVLPEEKDVEGEEPRIGVFVCNCGVNIGGVVNVPEVQAYARSLPNVVLSDENLFTCSQDTQEKMKKLIDEHGINRVVVASCSPRTHEPLFRATIRDAGLNKYLFEMANIRDQCSWVHMQDKPGATRKAKDLVRMAVTNANYIKPLKEVMLDVNKKALVVGGGIAGMTAALHLANQNFEVFLAEKSEALGGNLRGLFHTVDGLDLQEYLAGTMERVTSHPLIHVITNAEAVDHSGFKGSFETGFRIGPERRYEKIAHGVVVLATGGEELKPAGTYLYGEDERVMTQMELEERLEGRGLSNATRIAMIQCVGSRNDERPYCSRICCTSAVKNAIAIKEKTPETDVVIFFRDMMTYGFLEKYYLKARRLGVRFIRFEKQAPPVVEAREGGLFVASHDPSVGEEVVFQADFIALSSAIIPRENKELATLLKLPRTNEGFFLEAHMKLRPVDFASDGMFVAGLCHSPKSLKESIAQAEGAVARALTILSKEQVAAGGIVAHVDAEQCAACLTCVRVCPYSVPVINEKGEAEIDITKCKGCGSCAAECPAKAIDLMHYRDVQIIKKEQALCEEEPDEAAVL